MPAPTRPQRQRMEELDVEACLDLLRSAHLGRVGFVLDGEPQILPVNYRLHEGAVVFRTTYGTLLDTLDLARAVFEVDAVEPGESSAWSVVVRGKGEEVWRPEELERLRELPLATYAPGDRDHYVRILPSAITGRRIAWGEP